MRRSWGGSEEMSHCMTSESRKEESVKSDGIVVVAMESSALRPQRLGSPEKGFKQKKAGHDQIFLSKAEELRKVVGCWRMFLWR